MAKKATVPALTGTVIMPEDQEMNAALSKVATQLKLKITGIQSAILEAYYDTGELLKPAQAEAGKYGTNAIGKLEGHTGIPKEQLYKMIKFVEVYTRKQLTELVKLQSERGKRLTWGHVVHLLSVADVKHRDKLAHDAAVQEWSAEDLGKQLISKRGNLRPGSGRKFFKPKTLGQCVANLAGSVDDYVKRKGSVWDVTLEELAEKAADQYTPEMIPELDAMEASLEKLQLATSGQLKTLNRVRSHIKGALETQDVAEEEQKEED